MQTNPEPLPVAKLVELDDACLGLDEKPLADDEPTSFPIDAGELRELLRGYRVQSAFAEQNARLVGAMKWAGEASPPVNDFGCVTVDMSLDELNAMRVLAGFKPLPARKDRTHG